MKQIILLILSVLALQGCSVYGSLTKCEGFDEAGTRCTGLISNLDYSKGRESGAIPAPTEIAQEAQSTPDGINCADSGCVVQLDYDLLDSQVKNDEFARLVLDKKISMAETDPVLRPAKTVKATIYPYSDGAKFYQLRHIWIKTHEETWIVGSSMLVDAKGTVMMDKGATINMVGGLNGAAQAGANTSGEYGTENIGNAERDGEYSDNNAGSEEEATPSGDSTGEAYSLDNTAADSTAINTEPRSELNQESTKGIGSYKAGYIVTINVVYLNVRQKPSAKSRIIGVIPAGGKLQMLDETAEKWRRVRVVYYPKNQLTKEYDGWVNSEYLMATNPELETWEDAL
jgi:hypothetical protein